MRAAEGHLTFSSAFRGRLGGRPSAGHVGGSPLVSEQMGAEHVPEIMRLSPERGCWLPGSDATSLARPAARVRANDSGFPLLCFLRRVSTRDPEAETPARPAPRSEAHGAGSSRPHRVGEAKTRTGRPTCRRPLWLQIAACPGPGGWEPKATTLADLVSGGAPLLHLRQFSGTPLAPFLAEAG